MYKDRQSNLISYFSFDREKCIDAISVIGIGMLLSIPSIKLIYSSPIINIGVLCILIFAFLLQKNLYKELNRVVLYILWSLFSIFILSGFYNGHFLSGILTLIDYLYLIFAVLLVIALSNSRVLWGVGRVVFYWGLFLAFWQLFSGIPTSRDLGQHYLTVSLPIGVALSYALSVSSFANINIKYRIFYIFASIALFLALATLFSRSAILFPPIIFLILFTVILLQSKLMRPFTKLKWVGGIIVTTTSLVVLYIIYFAQSIELRQLYRISNMVQNVESESRFDLYGQAIAYIFEQPLIGYGTNSSSYLLGSYPHNIFLEILTHGGIILFIVFLLFISVYCFTIITAMKYYSRSASILGFLAASLFYFFQWNTSFSITSAYIPIGAITLFTVGFFDLHKRSRNANIYIRSNTDTQSSGKSSKST